MTTRREQLDLFVANILDVAIKGDRDTMEHPVFALGTRPDLETWEYHGAGYVVTVTPGPAGRPTIFDKDVWIYCISQLVEGANRGREPVRRVRITAHDFLRATGRGTGGKDYEAMIASLQRLRGVDITTRFAAAGARGRRATGRGLINDWDINERDDRGRMVSIDIELPEWLLTAVNERQVLTYHPGYYRLRKANERRLYELCRKFCGTQPIWQIGEAKLYARFGTRSEPKRFRQLLRGIIDSQRTGGGIPEYTIELDSERGLFTAMYTPAGKALVD